MQKAADSEEEKPNYHFRFGDSKECSGNEGAEQDYIPEIASVEQTLLGPYSHSDPPSFSLSYTMVTRLSTLHLVSVGRSNGVFAALERTNDMALFPEGRANRSFRGFCGRLLETYRMEHSDLWRAHYRLPGCARFVNLLGRVLVLVCRGPALLFGS
jgi:hypothetical protein